MSTDTAGTSSAVKLVGTWKLKSDVMEHKATGEQHLIRGEKPNGCLIFTPEGRMMAILTGPGRDPPRSDEERVVLLKTMVAYSGRYRVEGERFITKVDVSWCKWWNGQEHVRYFKITGNQLDIVTSWEPVRPELGSPLVRTIATWERTE